MNLDSKSVHAKNVDVIINFTSWWSILDDPNYMEFYCIHIANQDKYIIVFILV